MAIVLRIIAILIGLYMIYILAHAINKMHLNKEKLRTFTLLLPNKCILLIREGKDSSSYIRGYYINDTNPLVGSTDILVYGSDINPNHPVIDENAPRVTVRIPHELVLNDLVDVRYVEDVERVVREMDETSITNERKKKKGSR